MNQPSGNWEVVTVVYKRTIVLQTNLSEELALKKRDELKAKTPGQRYQTREKGTYV